MAHYLIVADGDFQSKELIAKLSQDKIIVALDGAADRLIKLGIKPAIILGDFDSIDAKSWDIQKTFHELDGNESPYYNSDNILIVPAKNQQLTDLQKAIAYCDQQAATNITIICALGGRLDHHEGNLRALRWAYQPHRPLLMHTNDASICFLKNEAYTFSGQPGDKCGILAFPAGSFTSQGLVYEGNNFPLIFGESESTSNALKNTNAWLSVTGEALLIMPLHSI